LPNGNVDQKRLDALDMLSAIRATLADGEPLKPNFRFEWTHLWDEFVFASAGQTADFAAPAQAILDELRLQGPQSYQRVETRALLRAAAAGGGGRDPSASQDDLRTALRDIRAKLGLYARADLDRWMVQNELDETSLERLLRDEVCLKATRDRIGRSIEPFLLDELRLSGDYPQLAERARAKQSVLAERGSLGEGSASLASAAVQLWYFESRLGGTMPDDIVDFARRLGFADVGALDDAIRSEWTYLQSISQKS
jgi:hypothetical protein